MRKLFLASLSILFLIIASSSPLLAEQKLLPSDGSANDRFGSSVDVYNDYVVVGAQFDDDNGTDSGTAYVFERSGGTWVQQAKLTPSDGVAGDYFGTFVSISGDYIVVSAWGDDDNGNNSGSAYVFVRSGSNWVQQAKLLASDGASGDFFGENVSLYNTDVIIGAQYNDDNGSDSGSAYVFEGASGSTGGSSTAVGGTAHMADKSELLAHWIVLTALIFVTVAAIALQRSRQNV